MFLGYPDNHAEDVYQFLNISTNKVVMSKDIKWLNVTYGAHKKKDKFQNLIYDLKEELQVDKEERFRDPVSTVNDDSTENKSNDNDEQGYNL